MQFGTIVEIGRDGEPLTDVERGKELIALSGRPYWDMLDEMVASTMANTYFEIGTFTGDSLARVNCASIAVDPEFKITQNVVGEKPSCFLFQMTSDEFFTSHQPKLIFGKDVEFAFLDGMHLFEYLLRDFINTERHCSIGAWIGMHDCLPPTYEMTNRNMVGASLNPKYYGYWTGDVWKIVPILREFRPDLKIDILDCPPTGLTIISNLDPNSTVLADNYDCIVAKFANLGMDFQQLEDYISTQTFIETNACALEDVIEIIKRGK